MHTLLLRASVLLRTKVDPMAQQPQPPRTPPVSGASRPGQPSIGELVSRICENITDLIRSELALARAKGVRMATAMSAGAAFLVVAGIMALYGLGFILSAVVDLIALALPVWAAELIVAAVLLLVAAVAAALGIRRLSAAKLDAPDPQARLKDDVDAVKRAVASGLERGGQQ